MSKKAFLTIFLIKFNFNLKAFVVTRNNCAVYKEEINEKTIK